jgi:mono/diheme cytochrome c family protein
MRSRRLEARRSNSKIPSRCCSAAVCLALIFSIPSVALAVDETNSPSNAILSPGFRFAESSGAALFAGICQGCHMPDGRGATGAGNYPSLVKDKSLKARGYPVYIVVRGKRAMPPIGSMMSDDQVAEVVNYLRTHFGNQYQDAVTAEDVKVVRP